MAGQKNDTLIGIAGAFAIIFFELVKNKFSIEITSLDWELIALAIGVFSVYTLFFKWVNWLDNKIFWRLYQPVLEGTWKLYLENLEDGSIRTGTINIIQTRDEIILTAINYKPPVDGPYSTWKSIEAILRTNELFFTYEVESSKDIKPFKRGYMKFTITSGRPNKLIGNYYDVAPSNCQGPIILEKV